MYLPFSWTYKKKEDDKIENTFHIRQILAEISIFPFIRLCCRPPLSFPNTHNTKNIKTDIVNEKYNIFFIYTCYTHRNNIHWNRREKREQRKFLWTKNKLSVYFYEWNWKWMNEWKRKSKEGKTNIKSFSFCLCD